MKKRWVTVLLCIAIPAAAALAVLTSDLRVYLMPGYVLRQAILESGEQLQRRFQGNPVLHISEVVAAEQQQALVQLKGEGVEADTVIRFSPRKLSGSISWNQGALNGRFYSDADSLAISSPQLTKDQWYGIAYDSFAEDISQIPLISWILTDGMLHAWEDALNAFRQRMLAEPQILPVPDLSGENLSRLTMALTAMKKEVSRTVITVGEESVPCYRIQVESSGSLLETVGLLPKGEEAQFSGTFYLRGNQLILMELSVKSAMEHYHIHGETEGNWEYAPITTAWSREGKEFIRLRTETRHNGTVLTERWQVRTDSWERDLSYSWEETTGEAAIWDQDGKKASLNLQLDPQGFRMETEELSVLAAVLKLTMPSNVNRCRIALSPGEELSKPDFRRPDSWSMEDLLTILEGLGSLLAIPVL